MTLFKGTIIGFNYEIELETEEEFKTWLKAKLLRYMFDLNSPAYDVLMDILGIKQLKNDVQNLDVILKG